MRKLRIKRLNIESLTHMVIALTPYNMFLLKKETYYKLKSKAQNDEMKMSFIIDYEEASTETVIEFSEYSDQYYKIDSVTISDCRVYKCSSWVHVINEIVVDAE